MTPDTHNPSGQDRTTDAFQPARGSGGAPRSRGSLFSLAPWIVAGAYAVTYLVVPHDGMWINDNGCKFIQMESIVRGGYVDFALDWPGRGADPQLECVPLQPPFAHIVGGRIFVQYSPVFAVLSSVPYRLLGMHGLLLLPMLGGLLTAHAAARLTARLVDEGTARDAAVALCWIITGLATPVWFYSFTFWEHTPALAAACGSVCFLLDACNGRRLGPVALSAAFAGVAVYFRDELSVFAGVLLLVFVAHRRASRIGTACVFVAALVAALAPLALFQRWALGSVPGFHFQSAGPLDGGAWAYLLDRWTVLRRLLLVVDPRLGISLLASVPSIFLWWRAVSAGGRSRGDPLGGYALLACAQGALLLMLHAISESPIQRLLHGNGLFSVCPLITLAMARRARSDSGERRTPARVLVLRIAAAFAVAMILLSPPSNSVGVHWGCRFLLPLYPLFAACASAVIAQALCAALSAERGRLRAGVGAAVLLALMIEAFGLRLLLERTRFSSTLNREAGRQPAGAIICRTWFLPQELFTLFGRRAVFLVRTDAQERELMARLRAGPQSLGGRLDHTEACLRVVAWDARSADDLRATAPGSAHRVCDGRLRFICVDQELIDLRAPDR